jgi:basic membrane lipoprotein Med (substrate-binding protein (PBP1-ABC) superfamily)
LPRLFEENIRNIKKTFEHTVPKLYFDIYDIIEYLLLERPNKLVLKR